MLPILFWPANHRCEQPFHSYLEGLMDMLADTHGVHVVGNFAYVTDRNYGLQIINVSNPSNCTLKGSCHTPSYVIGVDVISNFAYVADPFWPANHRCEQPYHSYLKVHHILDCSI